MQGKDKGNILISYLFKTTDEIKNIDIEHEMMVDIFHLVCKWKEKGYIKRFVIADDECISDRAKEKLI